MEYFWYGVFLVFGSIVGSFLNVVIYRLHTGKSLNGRSHCMSCGKTLSWKELFPIISWIVLKGRCWGCSSHIPSRFFIVELISGLSFMLVWHLFAPLYVLLGLNLLLISLFVVIAVYDIRHTIIPDELSILVGVTAILFMGYEYALTRDIAYTFYQVLAGLGVGGFFGGLYYLSKGKWMGLGDAKLALSLGAIVGHAGAFSVVVFSFWVGAGVSLVLIGVQKLLKKGKTGLRFLGHPYTIKSEIPFAPFLILGFLLVHYFHADIFDITHALFF